jgi:hypothetical protein
MEPVDRRRFLKSAGVVAGTAAVVGAPGLARAATEGGAEVVDSPGAVEKEPVVVYVRDAARGGSPSCTAKATRTATAGSSATAQAARATRPNGKA